MNFAAKCENTEYGRFHENSAHGRCSAGDYSQYTQELAPACCRGDLAYCPQMQAYIAGGGTDPTQLPLEIPMNQGQPICEADCRSTMEEFYSECNPRLAVLDPTGATQEGMGQFLAICQGMPPMATAPGGGH